MTQSMTAYGQFDDTHSEYTLIWEIRSVNNRYLDAKFRLPEALRCYEQSLREKLSKQISRGRVDTTLSIDTLSNEPENRKINLEAVEKWSHWQDTIHHVIPNALPLSIKQLIDCGDIFEEGQTTQIINEKELLKSFDSAIAILITQRSAEGARLQSVLEKRLASIDSLVSTLKSSIPDYELAHQKKWHTRVEQAHTEQIDSLRLHQELALLIAKSDVSEEIDRLESHIHAFKAALNSAKPAGKRLDFLLQEFNREVNTLGSKSIHKEITNASVEMKVLIDQLREQVQNIE